MYKYSIFFHKSYLAFIYLPCCFSSMIHFLVSNQNSKSEKKVSPKNVIRFQIKDFLRNKRIINIITLPQFFYIYKIVWNVQIELPPIPFFLWTSVYFKEVNKRLLIKLINIGQSLYPWISCREEKMSFQ